MNAVATVQTLGAAENVTAGRTGRANEGQDHFVRIGSLLFNKGGTRGEQTTAQNHTAPRDRPFDAPPTDRSTSAFSGRRSYLSPRQRWMIGSVGD